MSESTTTTEFELPNGITIDGALLTTVIMRKLKNSDILAIQSDTQLQKLSQEKFNIRESVNPVMLVRMNAAMVQMFGLMFAKVVESIGGVTVSRKDYNDMYQEDFTFMMEEYGKLNGIDAEASGDNPFVQLGL